MAEPRDTARTLAAEAVNGVLRQGRSLTALLAQQRQRTGGVDPRQRAAAQDLAYGVLRHYGRLRFYLDRLLTRPLADPELTGLLLVGLYELEAGQAPGYAVVNEAVAAAAHRFPRARGLVNAVLRNFQRRQAELAQAAEADLQAHWNFPRWWIEKLQAQYPADWQAILASAGEHPPMTLRVNRRRGDVAGYLQKLEAAGIAAEVVGEAALRLARPVPVERLPGFAAGEVSVQDLGAQQAAFWLDAADGQRVLDACAAPGGKTGHLLELHDLDLVALDADPARLARVGANLNRLGLAATLLVADAGMPSAWWDGRPFDRILLDAPCSASGVVRRHPDGKWLKRADDLPALAREQDRLLAALWPCLKRGGKLLYATCSLFREENVERMQAFLAGHADARLEALPETREGQLLPGPQHDGFFYARLVKT